MDTFSHVSFLTPGSGIYIEKNLLKATYTMEFDLTELMESGAIVALVEPRTGQPYALHQG